MEETAQPRMLVLARESRTMTQGELAAVMQELDGSESKVSQGYVSRAEAGRLVVAGDRLELFARALRYPVSLLLRSEQEVGAGPGLVHHRKKQSASAGDLRRIHAVLNLARIQLRALAVVVPRPSERIPHIPVDDYYTPEDAARELRQSWSVPDGPLPSVVRLLEQAGGLVACRALVEPVPLDSGAEVVPVDAVSTCPPNEDPVVLLNVGTPAERQRFTLAHELGHAVLHPVPHPEQEKQANAFAAELLLPARELSPQLQGTVDVPRLLELKAQWQVSMWALLRRAHTLGALSDWQYRSLAVELTSLGYRTREPNELPVETPTAIDSMVDWHLQHGHTVDELAETAGLMPDEFTQLYLPPSRSAGRGPAERSVSSTHAEAVQ
ncbi:helix-turn-helix domain-containing protein [Actinophytocola sp.]|uniref:helix-turn-helix domain-containing protein n=1 Tax=Actinophytocola sp. TaxID=1872138 RepID=UPI00389AA677